MTAHDPATARAGRVPRPLRPSPLAWSLGVLAALCLVPALARDAGAQDLDSARATYLDVVRGRIEAAILTDADVDAAKAAITALVAYPVPVVLETLSLDANRSGQRLLTTSVDLENADADIRERTLELKDKSGADRDDVNAKLRDLEQKLADLKALKPRLQALREALYEGVLTVTARVASEKPEEAYDVLVSYFKDDARQLFALEQKVSELDAAHSTLLERMPALKDAELAKAEREQSRLEAALEVRRADLERQRKLKERRIASIADVFGRLPKARQAKELTAIKGNLKDDVDYETRALYVEILGNVATSDAISEATNVLKRAAKSRASIEKELDPLRETYRRAAEALVNAAIGGNGMVPVTTKQNEEKCRAELTAASRKAFGESQVMEAAARAIGVASARLDESDRKSTVDALVAMAGKERDKDLRARAVDALGALGDDAARAALRDFARKDSEIGVRLAALDQLGRLKDEAAVDLVINELLRDGDWRARAAAMRLLIDVPKKGAVPALIESLAQESGRLVDDADHALTALTGQSFNADVNLWKDWWSRNKDTFEIGKTAQPAVASAEGGPAGGGHVSFYGIKTRSKRILFVLDRSGSMNEPATDSPTGKDAGLTKFDVARGQLKTAVAGLEDGENFNLITYSGDVTRWQKRMVGMSKQINDKFDRFVDKELKPVGGTNIYDALHEAFRLAGIGAVDKAYDSAVDTIFFLTDGKPSQGEVLDPEEIIKRVREWNRLARVTLHTVGVGKDHDASFLRRLAEENGGQYVAR